MLNFQKLLIVFFMVLAPTSSYSQVHKCVDEQGAITFSSAGCAAGEAASRVNVRQANVVDGAEDRRLAIEQEIRMQQELEERRERRSQTVIIGQQSSGTDQHRRTALCREATTPYKNSQNKQLTARQRAMAEQCRTGACSASTILSGLATITLTGCCC